MKFKYRLVPILLLVSIVITLVIIIGNSILSDSREMNKKVINSQSADSQQARPQQTILPMADMKANMPGSIEHTLSSLTDACEADDQNKIEEHKVNLWRQLRENPDHGKMVLSTIQEQDNPVLLSILVGSLKLPVFSGVEWPENGVLEQMQSAEEGSERRRILATFYSGHPGLAPDTVEALVELTKNESDAAVKQNVITAIGQNAPSEYCTPLFVNWAMYDPDPVVRASAVQKIPLYIDDPSISIETATDRLGDIEPAVRVAAVLVMTESDSAVLETRHFEKVREALLVEQNSECAQEMISLVACTWPDDAVNVLNAFMKVSEDENLKLYAASFINTIQEGFYEAKN